MTWRDALQQLWPIQSTTLAHRAVPVGVQPTVEWQVNGHCNYDCFYCIQSRASRVGTPSAATVSAIVQGFAQLPGIWEIKMSGGEPFAFRGFIDQVIPELIERTPHTVSVLTNFSAPVTTLERFAQLTGPRLRITSASLHADTADVTEFVEKGVAYRELRHRWNPHSSFVVNGVLVPGRIRMHFAYQEQLAQHGLRYFPQLMKIRGGVYPYDAEDVALIERLIGGSHDPSEVNRAPSYRGLHCEAGAWYFIVDQTGEAYTCRTGKKFAPADVTSNFTEESSAAGKALRLLDDEGGARARLGSFVRGDFQLQRRGGPCPYPICPCTVPVNRGIVRLPRGRQIPAQHQLSDDEEPTHDDR